MGIINQLTHEDYVNRVKQINSNFEIISEYAGMKNSIHRICKVCGDDRWVKASQLLKGRDCPVCAANKRRVYHLKTHDQFIRELANINPNVDILSEYETGYKKIKCRCTIDGNVWYVKPDSLLQGHGCPVCADRKQNRRSHDEFVSEMKSRYPNIEVLTTFTKVADKIICRCSDCGNEFSTTPNHLIDSRSKGCPYCSGHGRVTEQMFVDRLRKINDSVEYISGYYRLTSHVHVKCKACGNEWITLADSLMYGTGCPICRSSHGEKKIKKYLQDNNIQYLTEYRFKDCCNVRPLPFDFYIPMLNTCIEYDGEQHFRPVKIKNHTAQEAEEKYFDLVKRDNIKTEYCKANNIKLIRIPYTEYDDIEEKLDKLLA